MGKRMTVKHIPRGGARTTSAKAANKASSKRSGGARTTKSNYTGY